MTRHATQAPRECMDLAMSRKLFWERKAAEAEATANRKFPEVLLRGLR